ncbi:trimethylamine methyltransferase family protein [Cochlodiniinecator piscidefendens]|uniref:trimethylamine methyltransferase family protein n=1 Tax=Cochlodiniinecator piscidefendens TaxID=2715756 RepID=UPI00140BF01A|nr:trimethylamine methyltransferase family protein [Cochlodiniinecator piscidefendens]
MARTANRRNKRRDSSAKLEQTPWKEFKNPYPPIEVLDQEQLDLIHNNSLRILSDIGIKVLDARSRDYLRSIGALVDEASEMVKIDPGLVMEMIAHAPSKVRLHARNSDYDLTLGGDNIIFSSVMCPPFANDLDRGRRAGTFEEMCEFVKLVHSINAVHQAGGGGFEPLDLPAETRHLDVGYAHATLTDKTWKFWSNGQERARDAISMAKIIMDASDDDMIARPVITAPINTNSPLMIDNAMAEGIVEMAQVGQPLVIAPFTMAGAMSPATEAGALSVQNAEALAACVLAQAVRKGAPVVYGSYLTNVDMRTGSPVFGTPVFAKTTWASGQLARRYGLPFRSSLNTGSNLVDAQAAYETEMCLWAAVMGHANIIFASAGWLEGGLSGSYEKLILDAELLQLMTESFQPMVVNEDTLGFNAIKEVGPGGHFFGSSHTLERYEHAFYHPILTDTRNYETWSEQGSEGAENRANRLWKKLLSEYEQPPLDQSVDDALKDFVARRKSEIRSRSAA